MAMAFTVLLKTTFLLLCLFAKFAENYDATCDWEARSNFYAIKAILENKMRANDTLLYELAGIFSNKQRPLKQLIAHYKVLVPVGDDHDHCFSTLHCDFEYPLYNDDSHDDCPNGYHCISTDFIWGRYPATAQDTVFRDLDVCPLVIGDYEQRQITIYFILESPPSCSNSSIDDDAIVMEEFPCGWRCRVRRERLPSSGSPSKPIFRSSDAESHIDRVLLGITTKLLQYSTIKEALPSLEYDLGDTIGYATKVGDATYFHPTFEYVLFLSAYLLFHCVVGMVIYHQRNKIYHETFKYATKNPTQCALFWSGIVTFFISCFNVSFIFAIEGGACVTLLQLYIAIFSLIVPISYPFIAFFIKKKTGFFDPFNARIGPKIDHGIQFLVMWLLFSFPHIVVLITYLASVSFFHNASSTAFLGVYIALSTVTLWITNAIFIFLVFPYLCICCRHCSTRQSCFSSVKHIVFAFCLGLSINLMNFSVMPFIGDFYYDARADGSTILTIIPLVITVFGWYNSGKLVEAFSFSFVDEPKQENKPKDKVSLETIPEEGGPAINSTTATGTEEGHVTIPVEDDSAIAPVGGSNTEPSNSNSRRSSAADKFAASIVRVVQYFPKLNSFSEADVEENDLSDNLPSSAATRVRVASTTTL